MKNVLYDFAKSIFGIRDNEPNANDVIILVVTFLIFLLFVFESVAIA